MFVHFEFAQIIAIQNVLIFILMTRSLYELLIELHVESAL